MKTTSFTVQEIAEFNEIYQRELSNFIINNSFSLKEIRSFGSKYSYCISSFKDGDGYNQPHFKELQQHLLSYNLKQISYPYSPFHFQKEHYHQKFIEQIYPLLTPIQMLMYENSDFVASPNCVIMTKTFYQQPDILFTYLQRNLSTQFNIKSHHSDFEDMLNIWKNIFNESQFNTLIIQLFTKHAQPIKKAKKHLQLAHFLIDSLVDNIDVRQQLHQLFPLAKNINPFVQTESIWYEVSIDKKNLEKLVILPNQEAYKSMYQDIIESFQEIKSQFGIEQIQLDPLFKKKPIGSILVKIRADSSYKQNKFEEFLLISYHGYAKLYQDDSLLKGHMTKYLTYEWFMKNYLEKTMIVNSSTPRAKL